MNVESEKCDLERIIAGMTWLKEKWSSIEGQKTTIGRVGEAFAGAGSDAYDTCCKREANDDHFMWPMRRKKRVVTKRDCAERQYILSFPLF